MIERLPHYYRKSKIVEELYNAVQTIIDKLSADISAEDMMLFIATTTDFTLHEKDVGLSAITADNETKRARVVARIQGNGVLTKSALYELIDIYDSGVAYDKLGNEVPVIHTTHSAYGQKWGVLSSSNYGCYCRLVNGSILVYICYSEEDDTEEMQVTLGTKCTVI